MSKPISLRISDEIYSAVERLNREAGERSLGHTIRRLIVDGLNGESEKWHYSELINRLDRIESQTSVLEKIDLSQ